MAYTKNMTEGKPFPLIFSYFVPVLFSTICQQLYSIVDTIIVGKGINDMALAAVGATGSISFFIFGFIMGLGGGMTVIMAQAFGNSDYKKLRKAITMGLVSCGTVALVIMVFSLIFMRPILVLLNTSELIIDDAVLYIGIIIAGIPIAMFYNCYAAVLSALGDSRTPLIAVLISSVINIILDILFIMTFNMGVAGAAIATLIAQMIAGVFCFIKVWLIKFTHIKKQDWKIDWQLIWDEFRIGVPLAFMNSITAIGGILLQYFVNILGVSYTAAYSAGGRIVGFMMQPCAAAGITMSTYAGQNLGAGKIDRIRQGLRSSGGIAIAVAVITGLLLLLIPRQLISLILSDEENIVLAVDYLRVCGVMMWSISFLFLVRDTLQGMGYTFVPMLSGVLEMVARIAVVVLFIGKYGFVSIALAEVSAWASAFVLNAVALYVKLRPKKHSAESMKEAAL